MAYDPARHHRRSIRLPGYDYAAPGWYFVTICVQRRACLLGEITEDGMLSPSPAGTMATDWWHRLPGKFPSLTLDAFVMMPNHMHGILRLLDPALPADPTVRADLCVRPPANETGAAGGGAHGASGAHRGSGPHGAFGAHGALGAHGGAPLPRIIQWWKTMTTNAYIRGVRTDGWPRFDRRLWQRNYWERIIRTDRELANVRRYIAENPLRWHRDRLHPARRS
jgi:putative transposase